MLTSNVTSEHTKTKNTTTTFLSSPPRRRLNTCMASSERPLDSKKRGVSQTKRRPRKTKQPKATCKPRCGEDGEDSMVAKFATMESSLRWTPIFPALILRVPQFPHVPDGSVGSEIGSINGDRFLWVIVITPILINGIDILGWNNPLESREQWKQVWFV